MVKKVNEFVPRSNPRNLVRIGKARFTFLTDRMVRMEWAEDGRFEDRATLSVCHRKFPHVPHTVTREGNRWRLATQGLTLFYTDTPRPFSAKNLRAEFNMNGKSVSWHYGKKDSGNLGGSFRTLDGSWGGKTWHYKKDTNGQWVQDQYKAIELDTGLISRNGWAVIDDRHNVVLDPDIVPGRLWVAPRPEGRREDVYLLAYGQDYAAALRDGASLFGRQPLPPRYAFGYWYSKYWAYTDRELEGLVQDFDRMQIPIDVLVIDMDWHLPGWTGTTWDRRYFVDPPEFLRWVKQQGLKITLNLHPADGVADHEEAFEAMCKDLNTDGTQSVELPQVWTHLAKLNGRDPAAVRHIPFDVTDPAYMHAYFKHLHHPHETNGVDFWWMDWQQGTTGSSIPDFNPLAWINQLHWEDQERRGQDKRPLCFSRYGGLGAGRYPVGFSGDTVIAWESLAYQPYFTATAANVLYGYWSHDIGGHFRGEGTQPEMYTRWMQFGVYSPILRTHVAKNLSMERRVWKFADPYSGVLTAAIRKRYELVPYLYSEARKTVDSGLSPVRPMYYHWPHCDEAYRSRGQYMFGEHLLVAPVVGPVNPKTELAGVKVWLPEGDWIDTARGVVEQGGQTIRRRYTIHEVPVFVRPGTVIPGQSGVRRLEPGGYLQLMVTAYPGADGAYELYEDDGVTQGYLRGESVRIRMSQKWSKTGCTFRVHKARGRYRGFTPQRSLELRMPLTVPPSRVTVAGKELQWSLRLEQEGWTYDGQTATTCIRLRTLDVSAGLAIRIQTEPEGWREVSGLPGLLHRLDRMSEITNLVSPVRPLCRDERMAVDAAQTGNRIARNPAGHAAEMARLHVLLHQLPQALLAFRRAYRAQGEKAAGKVALLDQARGMLRATLQDFAC